MKIKREVQGLFWYYLKGIMGLIHCGIGGKVLHFKIVLVNIYNCYISLYSFNLVLDYYFKFVPQKNYFLDYKNYISKKLKITDKQSAIMQKQSQKSYPRPSSSLSFKYKTDVPRQLQVPVKQQLRRSSSSIKINTNKVNEGYLNVQRRQFQSQKGMNKFIMRNKGESSAESSFTKIGNNVNVNMHKQKRSMKMQTEPTQKKYGSKPKLIQQSREKAFIKEKYHHVIGWTQIDKVKYQLTIQKRLRESLERQNQVLKKQIAFLNNFGTSLRNSVNNKKSGNNQQILSSNKQKILNRLNKKRDGVTSLADKDNESTGLCSAKTKTYQQKIHQIYDQYAKKRTIPEAELVYEIASNYFKAYQDNYQKLYILFNQSRPQKKTELSSKIQDLLFLFQVPILYKQKPKQLLKSMSKQKLLSSNASKKSSLENSFAKIRVNSQLESHTQYNSRRQDTCIQYKSPGQILSQLELLIGLVVKNNKLLGKFVNSEIYGKLVKKIKENRQ